MPSTNPLDPTNYTTLLDGFPPWHSGTSQITYSFLSTVPSYYPTTLGGTAYWVGDDIVAAGASVAPSQAQQTLIVKAVAAYNEVANVNLVPAGSGIGDITFGALTSWDPSLFGFAWLPGWLGWPDVSGDVWLNNGIAIVQQPTLGDEGWATILHELGHALGLTHPFDSSPGLAANLDNSQYTVMSYDPHPASSTVWPITPMLYDIQALQSLYGANMSTRAGNTVYFGPNQGHVYDLADHGSIILTIWDAGGIDTIDAINQTGAVRIDLNAGHYSSIGALTNNVAIAFGAIIENARGGKGHDVLIGNSSANVLTGGGGNDTLQGQGGIDTASYATATAGVTVSLAITTAQATLGAGTDTLVGIENLLGGAYADTLTGNSGANVLTGGGGNDTLQGQGGIDTAGYANAPAGVTVSLAITAAQATLGAGTDTLVGIENLQGGAYADTLIGNIAGNVLSGGGGTDRLIGNGGNDVLNGQLGNDSLWGGIGADRFIFNTALNAVGNVDAIRDFSVVDDTILLSHMVFAQAGSVGPLAPSAFQAGAAAADASDRIVYQAATGALYYDADGTGATAQIKFATVGAGLLLTFADFVVA